MPDIIIKGKALIGNKLKNGTFKVTPKGIEEIREGEPQYFGTIIPAPVNFHTHLGDSFIGEEPIGTLPEIVGPNGFKMRHFIASSHISFTLVISWLTNSIVLFFF